MIALRTTAFLYTHTVAAIMVTLSALTNRKANAVAAIMIILRAGAIGNANALTAIMIIV